MRTHVQVCLTSLFLLTSVSAPPHEIHASMLPASAIVSAQDAAPAVKGADTPAGRGLNEFVDSFNAGGEKRQTWLETRTSVDAETRGNIVKIDAQLLQKYGQLSIVRIVKASPESVEAIVRHGTSDLHGYLTIAAETTEPFKVVDFRLRAATPEEIKGGEAE